MANHYLQINTNKAKRNFYIYQRLTTYLLKYSIIGKQYLRVLNTCNQENVGRVPSGRAIRYKSGTKAIAQKLHRAFHYYPSRKSKRKLVLLKRYNDERIATKNDKQAR
jgi:hypothetical protein